MAIIQVYIGLIFALSAVFVGLCICVCVMTGDKDADSGGDVVRRLLAATARVQHHSRLYSSTAQRGPTRGEQRRRRHLHDDALARNEQQFRQPDHLLLSQRQFQGITRSLTHPQSCHFTPSYCCSVSIACFETCKMV